MLVASINILLNSNDMLLDSNDMLLTAINMLILKDNSFNNIDFPTVRFTPKEKREKSKE